MTVAGYTVAPGFIDPGKRQPCFDLIDHTGRIVGQSTDREGIPELIAAKQIAALLVANCAKVGLPIECHARYQVAEDAFNDDLGIYTE